MGYYTFFSLINAINIKDNITQDSNHIGILVNDEYYDYVTLDEIKQMISDHCNGDPFCYTKWYSYDDDMIAFSKKHPYLLITIQGIGEEGDRWRAYYLNGKSEIVDACITFPNTTLY